MLAVFSLVPKNKSECHILPFKKTGLSSLPCMFRLNCYIFGNFQPKHIAVINRILLKKKNVEIISIISLLGYKLSVFLSISVRIKAVILPCISLQPFSHGNISIQALLSSKEIDLHSHVMVFLTLGTVFLQRFSKANTWKERKVEIFLSLFVLQLTYE